MQIKKDLSSLPEDDQQIFREMENEDVDLSDDPVYQALPDLPDDNSGSGDDPDNKKLDSDKPDEEPSAGDEGQDKDKDKDDKDENKDKDEDQDDPDQKKKKEKEERKDKKDEDEDDPPKPDQDDPSKKDQDKPDSPYVPLTKHTDKINKMKDKLSDKDKIISEQESKIKEFEQAASKGKLKDLSAKYAEKHNMEPDAIFDLFEIFKEVSGVDQSAIKKINEFQEQQMQEPQFNEDYNKNATPLIKTLFPDLNDDQHKTVKNKIKELAFENEESAQLSLQDIISQNIDELKGLTVKQVKRRTAEPSRTGNQAGDKHTDARKAMEDPDAIMNMSDDDFAKHNKQLEKEDGAKTLSVYDGDREID